MENVSKDEQDTNELEDARDSVMTIMFNNFGGGPYRKYEYTGSGFNVHEQIRLAEGMRVTAKSSRLMQEAAQSNFKDCHEYLKKWFGLDPAEFGFDACVKLVVAGVNKMHRVLSDNTKQIRFIDARNQKRVHFKLDYHKIMSFNSDNKWCEHGEKAVERNKWSDVTPKYNASKVFKLCAFRDKVNTAHVGSGYCIYIGPMMLSACAGQSRICECIYHEMSHKILSTNDVNVDGNNVYGKSACQELASKNFWQALKIADCWTLFFMEFYSHKFL